MGAKTKCNLLFVVMGCGLYITIGLIFNVFTIAAIPQEPLKLSSPSIPTSISQRIQHTIVDIVEEIVEEIDEKVPNLEKPTLALFPIILIFLSDLLIILSAMVPKMTFDECKKSFDGMKRWYDVAFLASYTVSF